MSKEESESTEQVKVEDHSSEKENALIPSVTDESASSPFEQEKVNVEEQVQEGEGKESAGNEASELTPTESNGETTVEAKEEAASDPTIEKGELDSRIEDNKPNEETQPAENSEEEKLKPGDKDKVDERMPYGTAPGSPSQTGHHPGYGGQGYMPMYGHTMYSPYGYPHYPQPPYYPGGYHPQYPMMPPPHMMPPQQYPPASEQTTGSPGRRYHMPPYHPYPPASPVLSPTSDNQPHYPPYGPGHENSPMKEGDQKEGPERDVMSDDIGAAASIKIYVKQRGQASEEVLLRRARKNAQSRARAMKHRDYVSKIETKEQRERIPEEQQIYETHQMRRKRKNDRSRERALEKKGEIDRILAKPVSLRSKIEKQFLENALGAKRRKNEGDRLRRQRIKELGLATKGSDSKPGISARGPLPLKYQDLARSKQLEQHHNVGPYGMPPHGYPLMPPPRPHDHTGDAPHSPGAAMYQL